MKKLIIIMLLSSFILAGCVGGSDDICIEEVGVHAEKAYRLYYKAQIAWKNYASPETTTTLWTAAHKLIREATSNLETLNESDDSTSASV